MFTGHGENVRLSSLHLIAKQSAVCAGILSQISLNLDNARLVLLLGENKLSRCAAAAATAAE
jgi:hypothetical protein